MSNIAELEKNLVDTQNALRLARREIRGTCDDDQYAVENPFGDKGCIGKNSLVTDPKMGNGNQLFHFIVDRYGLPCPLNHDATMGIYITQTTPTGKQIKLPITKPTMVYQTNDVSLFDYPKPVFTRTPQPYIIEKNENDVNVMKFVTNVNGWYFTIEENGSLKPVDHGKQSVIVYQSDCQPIVYNGPVSHSGHSSRSSKRSRRSRR